MLYTKLNKINQKERIMKTVLDIHGLSKNFDKQAMREIFMDLSERTELGRPR